MGISDNLSPGQILNLGIDALAYKLNVINAESGAIHAGKWFTAGSYFTLAKDASQDFLMCSPSTSGLWMHIILLLESSGAGNYIFSRGPTTTASGTPLGVMNRNDNSTNTTEAALYSGPTITDIGTPILQRYFGFAKHVAIVSQFQRAFIVKEDTDYLLRVTSSEADNIIQLQLDWNEHQNK